jgi:hypothetical protein
LQLVRATQEPQHAIAVTFPDGVRRQVEVVGAFARARAYAPPPTPHIVTT